VKLYLSYERNPNKILNRFVVHSTQHSYFRCPGIQYSYFGGVSYPYVHNKRMKKYYDL